MNVLGNVKAETKTPNSIVNVDTFPETFD